MKIHPLKLWLIENKTTQKDFAKLCNINAVSIHRIINYHLKGIPHQNTMERISKLTGIPKIEFFYPAEEDVNNDY